MARFITLEECVGQLKALDAEGFDKARVESFLNDTLIEPASLTSNMVFSSDCYTRNLIHKCEGFELLIIGWEPGQRTPVHGHEGELCWARVEMGNLRFTSYREVSEDPLVVEMIGSPIDAGAGHLDGPADIHSVENLKSSGEPGATLHLYSRPYPEFDIYDLVKGEKRRIATRYDSVAGPPS